MGYSIITNQNCPLKTLLISNPRISNLNPRISNLNPKYVTLILTLTLNI
jgi:hypothetical protein